jgi:multidrug efflux pump subunit AcrA (membrane-fusion protein)
VAVAPEPPKSRRMLWLILAGLGAAGLFAAYELWLKPTPEVKPAPMVAVRTVRAVSGAIERTLRLAGQTAATNFATVTAPRLRGPERGNELVLMFLAKSGGRVKKGEKIAEIDSQFTRDHIEDVKDTVLQSEQDIRKRKAEQALEWENLQQTLRLAKSELDKAKLDASAAELYTIIDRELVKLSVEEAEAQYKQLLGDAANKKAMHAAELRILEITHIRNQMHINRHLEDLGRLTMHAKIDGLAVMLPVYRGGEFGQIQQGDTVGPGQPFMRVVDTSKMQLDAVANQAEASELRIGQPVELELDAFPGFILKGKVYSIGALATGGWRQNYYIRNLPVREQIEGQDARLIPDLSGAASILLERRERVVTVPQEAVQSEGGQNVVYVKQGGRYVKRSVQLGLRSRTQVEITAGLQSGEEVALERPSSPKS